MSQKLVVPIAQKRVTGLWPGQSQSDGFRVTQSTLQSRLLIVSSDACTVSSSARFHGRRSSADQVVALVVAYGWTWATIGHRRA